MVTVGTIAVVRFPHDQTPTPAVAKIQAWRFDEVLVAKHGGPRRRNRWAKSRWVLAADVARAATEREAALGIVIDPLPPRDAT